MHEDDPYDWENRDDLVPGDAVITGILLGALSGFIMGCLLIGAIWWAS